MNDLANSYNNQNPKKVSKPSNRGLLNFDSNIHSTPKSTHSIDKNILNPIWLSVSEAAKLGGIQTKTIRRAIQSKLVHFKIIKDRYAIELHSLIFYLSNNTKLKNKLNQNGIGQYVEKWRKNMQQ